MEVGTSITLGELLPGLAALIGIGISWGSLSNKIDGERERNNEVTKRIEQKIETLEDDQLKLLKDFHDMRTKIDTIYERVLSMKICRPDCIYRREWERNREAEAE